MNSYLSLHMHEIDKIITKEKHSEGVSWREIEVFNVEGGHVFTLIFHGGWDKAPEIVSLDGDGMA